jgi:hypothetical protein
MLREIDGVVHGAGVTPLETALRLSEHGRVAVRKQRLPNSMRWLDFSVSILRVAQVPDPVPL